MWGNNSVGVKNILFGLRRFRLKLACWPSCLLSSKHLDCLIAPSGTPRVYSSTCLILERVYNGSLLLSKLSLLSSALTLGFFSSLCVCHYECVLSHFLRRALQGCLHQFVTEDENIFFIIGTLENINIYYCGLSQKMTSVSPFGSTTAMTAQWRLPLMPNTAENSQKLS